MQESPIGEVLKGRYEIKSALDSGGMGQVFTAWDRTLRRTVVVKMPHSEQMHDPSLRKRFLTEVRDLATHQHPYILSIENFGEHKGSPFAVLQFLGGGNLKTRIEESGGRQTLEEIGVWLKPIAAALDFVHSKNCLHRDVKPANIVFDDHGHPFLADFGISTALDIFNPEGETLEYQEQLTVLGGVIGSPAYVPPEAVDRDFRPQYDQYSLATVVYVALTGEPPFGGKTFEAILIAKAGQPPLPIDDSKLKGQVPEGSRQAIMKALAKDPDDRFESCSAFCDALLVSDPGRSAKPGWQGPLAGVIAVAVLLGGGYGLWQYFAEQRPEVVRSPEPSPATPTEPEHPTTQLGSTQAQQQAAVALCRAHGGNCTMDQFSDEVARPYEVIPIEMDAHEVTNEAFASWVSLGMIETRAEQSEESRDGIDTVSGLSWRQPLPGRDASDHPNDPVVHVRFDEAAAFCAAQGKRLPTHDIWEFSARGQEQRIFPWGDEWSSSRLRVDSAGGGLEPVQSHPEGNTPDGIADLAGSVWEWTTDVLDNQRIVKGGSWDIDQPAYFRSSLIGLVSLDDASSDIGFRCVRPVRPD